MTCTLTITPAGLNKDARFYIPSPVSSQFSRLIRALAIAVEAERDVEHADPAHAGFDLLVTEAEAAWDSATDMHRALMPIPSQRAEDQPLKTLAQLINHRRGVETSAELQDNRTLLQGCANWLVCPGEGATAERITAMLRQGRFLLDEINRMELYQPVEDAVESADDTFAF